MKKITTIEKAIWLSVGLFLIGIFKDYISQSLALIFIGIIVVLTFILIPLTVVGDI